VPVDPGFGERLARRVSELYADAELALLRRVARTLGRGLDAPTWATEKLLQLDLLRGQMARDLAEVEQAAGAEVRSVIAQAFQAGRALAVADLDAANVEVVMPPARARAIEILAEETLGKVSGVRPAALRAVTDVYQRTVADAAAAVVTGAQTRRDAAQSALDRFAGRGLTAFTDASGRNWTMESYTEMAMRTGAGQAAVQGHVDQLQAAGLDLVIVSDAPRECPLCAPWEGKVLSLGRGVTGSISIESTTTGRPVTVRVAGTLDEARRAGFQHPNCRHSVSAYLPGATRRTEPRQEAVGYEAQQRQRAIERNIRRWKTREALALDDTAAATARAHVAQWQAAMRDHLRANPALKRQSAREQIGSAR
jgi:hypothetical protein